MPNHRMAMSSHIVGRLSANRPRWIAACAAIIIVSLALVGHAALDAQSEVAKLSMKLGVPAYVFPGQRALVTLETMSPAPGIVILNPDNGDAPFSAAWQAQADKLRARGITVLGYVHTDYATRPIGQVEASIGNYFQSAAGPPHVSGIFLDNMSNSCSTESYYASLYSYILQIDPAAFVAANPGAPLNICFLRPGSTVADTFVTFEHDAESYISDYQGNVIAHNGTLSSGAKYPATRFWHLIYGADRSQLTRIIALASARHVGYVYVTDGSLPNPWDSVPSYILAGAAAAANPGQAGNSPGTSRSPSSALP